MDVIKNSFIYEKLLDDDTQPVRVLKVFLSSDFEAAKECELIYTFLKGPNRVECEAVSYVWGNVNDPENRGEILLHGHRHEITKNLESALRHLRFNDKE